MSDDSPTWSGQGAHRVGRGGRGTREDRSGAALADRLTAAGFDVVERRVAADGVEAVATALRDLSAGSPGWS